MIMVNSCTPGNEPRPEYPQARNSGGRFDRFWIAGVYVKHKMPWRKHGGQEMLSERQHSGGITQAVSKRLSDMPGPWPNTERRGHTGSQTGMSG